MINKLFLCVLFTILLAEISNPLKNKAEHKNNLINKFCMASIKSKLKFKEKQKIEEISHYTCRCFFKKYSAGSSIRNSRIYCRDKAAEKFNL